VFVSLVSVLVIFRRRRVLLINNQILLFFDLLHRIECQWTLSTWCIDFRIIRVFSLVEIFVFYGGTLARRLVVDVKQVRSSLGFILNSIHLFSLITLSLSKFIDYSNGFHIAGCVVTSTAEFFRWSAPYT
jgi:hypothetical protein